MKDIFTFLLKLVAKMITYSDFAEVVLKVAKVFFNNIVQFIEALVAEQDEKIEAGETTKDAAFKSVVDETEATFSGSPSFVPRGIIKIITEATVYKRHHPDDVRNKWAYEHNFFRAQDPAELRDAIRALNEGFGHGK